MSATVPTYSPAEMSAAIASLTSRVGALEASPGDSVAVPNNLFLTNVGKVVGTAGVVWKGGWNRLDGYEENDVVKSAGHLYINILEVPEFKPVALGPAPAKAAELKLVDLLQNGEAYEGEINLESPFLIYRYFAETRGQLLEVRMKKAEVEEGLSIEVTMPVGTLGHYYLVVFNEKNEELAFSANEKGIEKLTVRGSTGAHHKFYIAIGHSLLKGEGGEGTNRIEKNAEYSITATGAEMENVENEGNPAPAKDPEHWQKMI